MRERKREVIRLKFQKYPSSALWHAEKHVHLSEQITALLVKLTLVMGIGFCSKGAVLCMDVGGRDVAVWGGTEVMMET